MVRDHRTIIRTIFIALAFIGAASLTYVLFQTMRPTEMTLANRPYFEVGLDEIPEGEARAYEWHGKPFWIVHRSEAQINSLRTNQEQLRYPSLQNEFHAGHEIDVNQDITSSSFFVVSRLSSASPCGVVFQRQAPQEFPFAWNGGFVDRCKNVYFDLSGRVYRASRDDTNNLPTLDFAISHSRIKVIFENTNDSGRQ